MKYFKRFAFAKRFLFLQEIQKDEHFYQNY